MRCVLTILTFAALAGCADQSPIDELSAAQHRWSAWGPASYDITIRRSCECLPAMSGPVLVVVRQGVIVSRTYLVMGQPVGGPADDRFPDVVGLFALMTAAARDYQVTKAEYDAVTGAPRHFTIDYDGPVVNGADGEVGYVMTLVTR